MRAVSSKALAGQFLFGFAFSLIVATTLAQAREPCRATLRDFGAAGDGKADDSPAFDRALASGCALSGENLAYRITRPIVLPTGAALGEATILQALPPGAANRAVVAENVSNIALTRLRLDRGADPAFGLAPGADPYRAHLDSAGVFLAHVEGATLTDVEIFGDGVGTGIKLVHVAHARLLRPYVHDMRWASPVQPENEVMVGIWAEESTDVRIESPRIANLEPPAINAHGGRADGRRNNMTDGVASSGAADLVILDADVSNVGEGFDFSGSRETRNFQIVGARTRDIDSYCYKITHADGGAILRSRATGCGLAGFVLAGRVKNVALIDNEASDIGANGLWPRHRLSGFSLELSRDALPTGIVLRGNRSIDRGQGQAMTFGFFNAAQTDRPQVLEFRDNVARGHARAALKGFGPAGACVFDGVEIADGAEVTAFEQGSVPAGHACVAQTRLCAKGALSGSFPRASCAVEPAR